MTYTEGSHIAFAQSPRLRVSCCISKYLSTPCIRHRQRIHYARNFALARCSAVVSGQHRNSTAGVSRDSKCRRSLVSAGISRISCRRASSRYIHSRYSSSELPKRCAQRHYHPVLHCGVLRSQYSNHFRTLCRQQPQSISSFSAGTKCRGVRSFLLHCFVRQQGNLRA